MEVTPHPPVRRWQEELDPAAQLGPYQPPVVLLDLLARLLGAESYAAADEPRRRRIRVAAEQIRSAGLDPRVIGLVTEPRITELMGVSETTGRSTRQRDGVYERLHRVQMVKLRYLLTVWTAEAGDEPGYASALGIVRRWTLITLALIVFVIFLMTTKPF